MAERHALEALVRWLTAPQQVVVHARIVLLAADGFNNSQIARALGLEGDTVRLWRARWHGLQRDSHQPPCVSTSHPLAPEVHGDTGWAES